MGARRFGWMLGLLYVLEDPIRAQTCLRNIFETTSDGMERMICAGGLRIDSKNKQ